MLWGFFGILIFAIIARILCGNHLKMFNLYVLNDSNLLSVHVDSAFSVPDSWQIQVAQQFNYTASLPVPISSEVRSRLDYSSIEILKMMHQSKNLWTKLQYLDHTNQGIHSEKGTDWDMIRGHM